MHTDGQAVFAEILIIFRAWSQISLSRCMPSKEGSVCVLRRSTRGPEYQLQVVLADGLAIKKKLGPASYRPPGVWRREQSSRRGLIHAACRESAKSLPTMVGKEQGAGLSQNEAPQLDWRAVKPIHRLRSQARITKGGRQVRMNLLE